MLALLPYRFQNLIDQWFDIAVSQLGDVQVAKVWHQLLECLQGQGAQFAHRVHDGLKVLPLCQECLEDLSKLLIAQVAVNDVQCSNLGIWAPLYSYEVVRQRPRHLLGHVQLTEEQLIVIDPGEGRQRKLVRLFKRGRELYACFHFGLLVIAEVRLLNLIIEAPRLNFLGVKHVEIVQLVLMGLENVLAAVVFVGPEVVHGQVQVEGVDVVLLEDFLDLLVQVEYLGHEAELQLLLGDLMEVLRHHSPH